ncbi:hypothetical protein SAMN04487900_11494 [Prevotella communis]|uniref:Uncharacterized protein n=1 Tax=Prevotella communis TaxID=2913614 RepID=A0A1H0IFJ3_9BACT|nr:hypothetical protein [Prevotella communis]SDO30178.1 hypothetical protein SAMN04487900_11494 [Prevotella communis]
MSDLLEEIFSRVAAFETGGRHIDYIKLDMITRQVEVKLTAVPGGEYYDTILAQQQDTIQQARQDHAVWTKRHGGGVTEEDLTERVGLMLKSLLDTKFLRDDYYEIPRSKRTKAKEELEQLGLEVDCMSEVQILRYALLRDMVDLRMGRFEFDNKEAIGNYMYENRDTYSPARYGHYFRFETTLGLIYQDLDQLKKANRDRKLEECMTGMLTDMQPLREHVVSDFSGNYDELLDAILMVGDLQKKLKQVSPNTFKGGYNQKLTCNLVGLLCGEGVYDVNPKQADALIYTGKTHYTYINNYANYDSSDSEITREEVKAIKEVIKKHT